MTLKSNLKQDNVAPPPSHNFILFELHRFPLLRILLFLSDLKSTICEFTTREHKLKR